MQGQTISAMQCSRSLKQPGVCYLLHSSQKICEALQHQRHGTAIQACHEALQHEPCSAAGLTLVSSWEGGAVGGEVLLTKRPSGLLSMPAVRFRVMTMEVPSNQ